MNSTKPSTTIRSENYHHKPTDMSDKFAYSFVKCAVFLANIFFRERYGHRAVVLETLAAIPGMVGGLFQHLSALRHIRDDRGWIKALLGEAENERMHLMIYAHIAKPTTLEKFMIIFIQITFYLFYFIIYLFSPRTGHRLVGYLEEEAVHSYKTYLNQVNTQINKNIQAPEIAIQYWGLPKDSRLSDVILATIKDEEQHRDANHSFANKLKR